MVGSIKPCHRGSGHEPCPLQLRLALCGVQTSAGLFVGTQGIIGLVLQLAVVFPLISVLPGADVGNKLENIPDSLHVLGHSWPLMLLLVLYARLIMFCLGVSAAWNPISLGSLECYFRPILGASAPTTALGYATPRVLTIPGTARAS